MAVSKQEVILEFNADTSDVSKSLGQVEKGIEGTSKATEGLTNQLDKMTGGAVTGLRKLGAGLKTAATGFKTLRGAVIATGIGALLIAITSLVAYFKRTERGAQQLRKITATLGAVMDKLVDVVIGLGEVIFNAFTNPKKALTDFAQALKQNIINRFEGLLELVPALGKAVGLLFEGKFGEAAKTASDAVGKVTLGVESVTEAVANAADAAGNFANEIARTAQAAADLADRQNKLKVAEREFLSVRAETNRTIAENRLLVEDETLAFKDRIGALDEAIAAEERTIAKELEFARERAAILEEQAALAESDEETKQAVAEAQAAVIELETRSLRTQKRLEGERQSLILQREARAKQEQAAAQKAAEEAQKAAEDELAARQKLEDELFALTLTAQEREELAAQQKFDERVAIAGDDEGLLRAATERLQADLAAIEQKYLDQKLKAEQDARAKEAARQKEADDKAQAQRDKDLADAEALQAAKYELAKNALGALSALNEAFAKEGEQQSRRNFKIQKALSLAQTTIGAVEGVQNAFTTGQKSPITALFPGYPFVQAGIAAAFGAAQIATVGKSKYQGGGTTPSVPSGGGGGGGGAAAAASGGTQAPQLDLGFLGAGAGQEAPVQAYVLAENVSTAQQANQKIQDQATL